MGHFVEALKNLDQQRAPIRPKPPRGAVAAQPAPTIWRIDEPQNIAPAQRTAELFRNEAPNIAAADRRIGEGTPIVMSSPAPTEAVAAPVAAVPVGHENRSAAVDGWRFPAPKVSAGYHELAAGLMSQARHSRQPVPMLLCTVSDAGRDAVSLGTLAVALSAQGNVLWIDTQNIWPTPAAVGPALSKKPGWHELRLRLATWPEIITPTSLPGVSFVGCGDRSRGGIGQSWEGQPFTGLGDAFAFVLIGGGLAEESASLATVCGLTGLVVAVGHERRSQVNRAIAALNSAGGSPPVMIACEPLPTR